MKSFSQNFVQTEKFNLFVIFIVASCIMLPIFFYGVPNGYDLPHHYQCALTFREAILSGDFYPSWTNLRNLGYGGLELRLYPPVSHYVLALFSILFDNWHISTWLTFTFWWILGSFGVYLWAREIVSPRPALIAALIYAVMPYRLNQAYLVFFYGELAGSAILPFCFAFLARVVREQKNIEIENFSQTKNHLLTPNVIGLAVSFAVLILTHLPLTLIVSFALVMYGLANTKLDLKYNLSYFSRLAVAVFLALISTSFFWIKVVQERAIMAKTLIYEDIYLHYHLNFLLTPLQSYDAATIVVYDVFTLVYDIILLITLFSIIPLALLALFRKNSLKNQMFRSIWLTFLLAVFLTILPSKPIWDNFSLLQEVQFPWRWLSIVSLFAPLIAAAGVPSIQKWFVNKRRPFALIIVGMFFIGASFSISNAVRGAIYTPANEVNLNVQEISNKEGFKFWWTIWTREEFLNYPSEKVNSDGRGVTIEKWEATFKSFTVEAGKDKNLRIAVFYHPNWRAFVNNQQIEINPDLTGAILVSVPAQSSRVTLEFLETNEVLAARKISLLAWIFMLVILTTTRKSVKNQFDRL